MLKQGPLPAQLLRIACACTDHPKIAKNSVLRDANGTSSAMPALLALQHQQVLLVPPTCFSSLAGLVRSGGLHGQRGC